MWNTLSAAIVAKIQTSNEVESSAVQDFSSKITQYPSIQVTAAGNQESYFADTNRVGRTYNFNVDIYQERFEQGEEEAERILRTIVDDLISIFDADIYLSTTLAGRGYQKPFNGDWGYTGDQLNTRSARIIVGCQVIQ